MKYRVVLLLLFKLEWKYIGVEREARVFLVGSPRRWWPVPGGAGRAAHTHGLAALDHGI